MATEKTTKRILHELDQALDTLNADLNRVEILSGALAGFSLPVPDYEPRFRHMQGNLGQHQLTGDQAD